MYGNWQNWTERRRASLAPTLPATTHVKYGRYRLPAILVDPDALLLWFVILAKIQLCFLGSHVSLVVPIPSPLPPVPGTFCVPIPDPLDASRITLHLMALHRKMLSTELRRGWHPIRAQERIKGTMLFFLCELDSGFRLQMSRMAWRTGVHLIPWLYPSKHLQI